MWPRFISIAVGLGLMSAPGLYGYGGLARTNDTIVGALAVTSAIIALSEVMRPIRWVNVALGVSLLVSPWYLAAAEGGMYRVLAGLVLLSAGLVRGRITSQFGGGWSSVWQARR